MNTARSKYPRSAPTSRKLLRGRLPLLVLAPTLVLLACSTNEVQPVSPAEEGSPPTATSNELVLSPGFTRAERDGTAVGQRSEPSCQGMFPEKPQFEMVLEQNTLALSVDVEGDDLVLYVRSGRSKWCGKVDDERMTVGRGAWSKGSYEIFVGTRAQGGQAPFKLRVDELR